MKRFLLLFITLATFAAAQVVVPWNDVEKTGSSLADFATRSASDLNTGTLPAARLPAFTGDVTASAGTGNLSLGTVNSNVGAFGSATQIPVVTVNGKGLITGVTVSTVTPAWSSITSKPTTRSGYGITDVAAIDLSDSAQREAIADRAGYLYGPPSALVRLGRDAFEFSSQVNTTRKFSHLLLGDSLGARTAGFLAFYWEQSFRSTSNGVALSNTGQLWSSGALASASAPVVGAPITVTAPAVRRGIETADPQYAYWPSGQIFEVPATGILQLSGGDGRATASRIKLYYVREPGAGTLDVQTSANGSTWTTIATVDAAGALAGAISTTDITRALVYIRVLGVTGTVRVIGFGFAGGTNAGWLGAGICQGGLSLADAATANPAIVAPIIADIDPTVITVHFDDAAATFASSFATFKSLFDAGAPNASWIVIGNGPKSPGAGGDAVSVAQNAWLRANADALGFAHYDSQRASGSWANVDALGMGGDGTHLSSSLYASHASAILDEVGRLTSVFKNRIRGVTQERAAFRSVELNGNEPYSSPATTGTSAGTMRADGTNFFVELLTNRGFGVLNSDGSSALFRAVSFEGNSFSQLMPRAYLPNMTGSLPATYTTPTTGGVLYSETNELKWRNAATGVVSVLKPQLTATAALDFPSIAAAAQADITVTVTGAAVGDSVAPGLPASPIAGLILNVFVSATDTVTFRASNITSGAIDPPSATYRATVLKP